MSNEDAPPISPVPAPKKTRRPGRWRRRAIWALSIFIILVFTLRGLLPLALPTVMKKVAGAFGLNCTYDRLELNLFSGDAGIWGLEFTPKKGGPAILTADYCHGNVSVLNLFKGKLNVWRVEADGVDVNIDRNPDGHLPLLDRFVTATAGSKTAATPVGAPATAPHGQMDLSSPLRIDALRLSHIRVHIHDRGVTPELDTELAMDLRLSDLGSATLPTRFEMNLSADPLLDSLKVTGEGTSGGKNLSAKLNVLARGIRLKPAAAYLSPFGIVPVSDAITMTAAGEIRTAPAPGNAEGFTGSIAFDHLAATADRQETMAVDHLQIDAAAIDSKSIHLSSISLRGARATAGRAADGKFAAAGIEYDPSLIAKPSTAPAPPPGPTPALAKSLLAEHVTVDEIALRDARLKLHDQGIAPPVDLACVVDELSAKSIDYDPANLNTHVTLSGLLHLPGLIKQIQLTGSAAPFADEKTLTATLNATGIRPDAIKPYLDQIGLESTLKDGKFTATMNASLSIADTIMAGMHVSKFDFADQTPLLSLSAVAISKATIDTRTGKIAIGDIELAGPSLSAVRDPSGQLAALGFRTKPPTPQALAPMAANASATTQSTPTTLATLPGISIGKLRWKEIRLDLEDQTVVPSVKIEIPTIGLEADDLSTDLDAKAAGHFKAFLASDQIAKSLQIDGHLSPLNQKLLLDASVTGAGLDTTAFTTYLKPFGIEPVLRDGGLTLHAAAEMTQTGDGLSATVGLDHLQFTAGQSELAGVDEITVKGISLRQGILGVDAIEITHPRAAARRDADGSLVAGGIRLLPTTRPAPDGGSPAAVAAAAPAPASQPASPLVVALKKVSVTDAGIDWNDLSIQPPVSTSAGASVEVDNLTLGRDADPAALHLTAHAAGSADSVIVTGNFSTAPRSQSAVLDISATGLRVGPLAPYLPAGAGSTLKDGHFHTTVDADVTRNPAGGIGAQLKVGPLSFRDGTDSSSLFQLDSARLIVPQIDWPDHGISVDEISVTGVQTHAEKTPTGELACMGLLLGGKTTAIATTAPPPPAAVVTVAPPPPPTTGPSAAELIAASRRVLPAITINKLDLNISHVTLTDLSRPQSSPLVVSDLHLGNVNRIDWLGKGAENKPPTRLSFACRISPLVDQVQVDALIAPFARQPTLVVDFSATGIHGDGLTQLIPELKNQIDGSSMSSGSASAHLEAEAKLDRRSPLDFDVSRGFDFTFDLSKVQYRAQPDGPVLAGVDEVRSDNIRIAPADSIVHFKTLEIDKPIGLVTQDQKGVHALGWVYRIATTQPAAPPAGTVVVATPTPVVVAPTAPPNGEVRIDKLLISGLDFKVDDHSVTPPLVIPLNGLDVEVRNISSLSPYQDKPIRFSAIVNADKVKLRKKGGAAAGTEDRDLFSQITANGEVSLYPKLHGWAKTSVSGLDLAALEGPAQQLGETLTGGVYDSTVDLRFDPTGAVAITSRFVLTDLSLSEPANGLIYRTLHLPAPLDTAIGAVEGADGSISLPLNVAVDPKHISYADIGLAASGGVSQVILTALAAAPIKAVNDVGGLINFGGPAGKPTQDLTTSIAFAPGSAAVGPAQYSALVPLLRQLRNDPSLTVTLRHQLGSGDVRLAAVRANPTPDECRNLEVELRSRKQELLQLRANAAGSARAQLAGLGAVEAQAALDHLKAIDRELASTEESLDQMGEMLRPGADRLTERRTRAAALQIATDRLTAIQTVLLSKGISPDRVKMLTAPFNPSSAIDGGQVTILAVEKK